MESEKAASSPSQNALWPLALLGILVSTLALFSSKRTNSKNHQHPQDKTADKHAQIPGIASHIKANAITAPHTEKKADGSKGRNPLWGKSATLAQIVVAFVTAGLLIVNVCQMRSTEKAANTAVQSFSLAKRHAEDSDEARCVVSSTIDTGSNISHLTLENSSKTPARNVHAHIEISENRLPGNERIKLFATRDIAPDELENDGPIPIDVVLEGLGKQEWDSIKQTNESLVVSSTIQYDNGFDRIRHVTFCTALVFDNRPGIEPRGFSPRCDALATFLQRSTYKWSQYGKVDH